jgi:Ala-tRNA(Pro) deacylase
MSVARLKDFLDNYSVRYVVISHSPAYTAQGIAAVAHIPGKTLAKTVIVKIDGSLAMAVVPASGQVNLPMLRAATGGKSVELASEMDFRKSFPDCETGAMPPFGNLYGMAVYADESLAKDEEIAFNAGTHRELFRMSWADYVNLVSPRLVKIAALPGAPQAA